MAVENRALVLSFPRVDAGNVVANVAQVVLPCKITLERAVLALSGNSTANCEVNLSDKTAGVYTANSIAVLNIAASSKGGSGVYNVSCSGKTVNAGAILILSVDTASDAGLFACVSLYGHEESEVEANESNLVVSAA